VKNEGKSQKLYDLANTNPINKTSNKQQPNHFISLVPPNNVSAAVNSKTPPLKTPRTNIVLPKAATPTKVVDAPPKVVKGTCLICLEDNVALIKPSSACKHAENYCISCIRSTIKEELDGKGQTRVCCPLPACKQDISTDELLTHTRGATEEKHKGLYARLDHLLMQSTLRSMTEFRNCSNPRGCGSGQCIEGGATASNFFDCHVCHFRTCINHKAPHHHGLTCAEYDAKIKERDEQSDAWKAANTKKCPQCKVDIEKNEGCDAMTCCVFGTDVCNRSRRGGRTCDHGGFCGHKFCWLCLGADRPDGSKFHNAGCKYFGYT
jgi:hypothetical protein